MRKLWILCVIAGLVALAGCGDDDDGGDALDDPATLDPADELTGSSDELALGDPCELVPDTLVSDVIGEAVTGDLAGVEDGLPGAMCNYVGDGGFPLVALSLTPDGAAFVDANLATAEDVTELPNLADGGFQYLDTEIQVKYRGHQLGVQFPSGEGAGTSGLTLIESLMAALD